LRCGPGIPGSNRSALGILQLGGGRVPALAAVFAPKGRAIVQCVSGRIVT
jgi:hypothetical protein